MAAVGIQVVGIEALGLVQPVQHPADVHDLEDSGIWVSMGVWGGNYLRGGVEARPGSPSLQTRGSPTDG